MVVVEVVGVVTAVVVIIVVVVLLIVVVAVVASPLRTEPGVQAAAELPGGTMHVPKRVFMR